MLLTLKLVCLLLLKTCQKMLMFYKNEIIMEIDFYGILVVPGYNMTVDLEFSKDRSNFFRLYAFANNEEEILKVGKD